MTRRSSTHSTGHAETGRCAHLVYSTAAPESLRQVQDQLGAARAGELVERAGAGCLRAGSGRRRATGGCRWRDAPAASPRPGITQLQIGAQIDPGVPWCAAKSALADTTLHVALKSGNFLGKIPDFFTKAFRQDCVMVSSVALELDSPSADICRVGRSLFDRGYVHGSTGNISVRVPAVLGGGFLITPDRCLPRASA